MPRASTLYLRDMLDAIQRIYRYIDPFEKASFVTSEMVRDAVVLNLMIIGEAAGRLDESITDAHESVDWRNIKGLRNIIAHEYFRLKFERLWNIIETELPLLKDQISTILTTLDEKDDSDG